MDEDIEHFSNIEDTLELLKISELKCQTYHKDVVLLVGNTGSGKSSFAKFVAGDNSKLKSIEVVLNGGDYVIEDDEHTIGHEVTSKTIIPNQIIDPESRINYCDCPGFGDTRNSAYDISATYNIKNVLDHAKYVKILLLVNYPSVRVGGDRRDFMELVKHTTEFLLKIDKYKKSIALVVTKVDDYHKSNAQIKINIVDFLKKVQETLDKELQLSKSFNFEKQVFNNCAVNLINILLAKTEDQHENIIIFRRPSEKGKLSDLKLFQDDRTDIKRTLEKNITFTLKSNDDFGYTISSDSKNDIIKLVEKINNKVVCVLDSTARDLAKYFQSVRTQQKFNKFLEDFENTVQELENSVTMKEYIVKLTKYMDNINIKTYRNAFLNMMQNYNYMQFFKEFLNNPLNINVLNWTKPFRIVLKDMQKYKPWTNFILSMYSKISYTTYLTLQRNKYDILEEIKRTENHDRPSNTIVKLISTDHNLDISDTDDLITKQLYEVLQTLLTDISYETAEPETLLIKGEYVKFSDLNKHLNELKNIKYIIIFALNSVFIDEDFLKQGCQINLFVIAPSWEVIDDRRIILDGFSGEGHRCSKAKDEEDGLPGLPGSSAGSFIGICRNIINGKCLTVSACGGKGGPGQDGGDGRPGEDGKNNCPTGTFNQGLVIMHENGGYEEVKDFKDADLNDEDGGWLFRITKTRTIKIYKMYGKKGTRGKDACRAGSGGKGGYRGNVCITEGFSNDVSIKSENGEDGEPGKGGQGGLGGKNADDELYGYIKISKRFGFIFTGVDEGKWDKVTCIPSNERAESGLDCTVPTDEGISTPNNPDTFNICEIINQYKKYIWNNLTNVRRSNLIEFYSYLHNNIDVKHFYDSHGLLDELQNYESEYNKSNKNDDMILFYKFLLERIQEFVENNDIMDADKKHLNYLFTATLGRILNMNVKIESNLIIDIENYLEHLLCNFDNLDKQANEIVNYEFNQQYKNNIDKKIDEAFQFLEKHVLAEIHSTSEVLKDKLNHLLADIELTNYITANNGTEKRILMEKSITIGNLIKQQELLKSFSWFHKILNITLKCGETTSSIIQMAFKVNPFLGLNNNNVSTGLESSFDTLLSFIKSALDFTKGFIIQKCEVLILFLDKVQDYFNQFPGTLSDIIFSVKNIRNKIQSFKENIDNSEVNSYSYTSEIKPMFEELKKEFEKYIDNCSKNSTCFGVQLTLQISQMLTMVNSISDVAELFPTIYKKYKDDDIKLIKIGQHVQEKENEINLFREIELLIHNKVLPLFTDIQNDIEKLEGQSRIPFNISNWKMQSTLKEMFITLTKISKGFNMDIQLEEIVARLKEAIMTQIYIYELIQKHDEHKELADYVANITSEQCMSIGTDDTTTNEDLTKLDFTIKSNVLFSQCDKALNGFIQFIFPFAHFYMKELNSGLKINSNWKFEDIVADAGKKIKNLKTELTEKNYFNNYSLENCVYYENFNGLVKNGPFYSWDNEKYKNTISKLLFGEEIVLTADILHSLQDKNAIKFNDIHINLRIRDESENDKLKAALKRYDVVMTHYGNSYFRFDNKFYMLSSDRVILKYNFDKDENRKPIRENERNLKMRSRHFILSPYATWSFQLLAMDGASFADLKEFEGKVNLELVGYGQYIAADNNISGENLQKYYNCIDVMSVSDVIPEI